MKVLATIYFTLGAVATTAWATSPGLAIFIASVAMIVILLLLGLRVAATWCSARRPEALRIKIR